MRRRLIVSVLWLLPAAVATAQTPGAYPHLVLTDSVSVAVPGPGGPFDSTGVYPAVAGVSFEAQLTYQALAQNNSNVPWGLLVGSTSTPYPKTLAPPPLFVFPPFLFLVPENPTLSSTGFGGFPLVVPAGVSGVDFFTQGIVYDVTNSPKLKLSNGVTIASTAPAYSVSFAFVRDPTEPDDGLLDGELRDFGAVHIDADTLATLKPVGPDAPPQAFPQAGLNLATVRFLPILHNEPDEPINPLALPVTRLSAALGSVATTLPVEDTTGFPTRGRVIVPKGTSSATNLWQNKGGGGADPTDSEVIAYDDISPTALLNCKRAQLGSNGAGLVTDTTGYAFPAGLNVVGIDFSMVTTSGAFARQRVSLDARNRDTPHVVIPPFTFDPGPDSPPVTLDLDLYRYEQSATGVQGFLVLDRLTHVWRVLEGTQRNLAQGRWDPMLHVSPDRRFFVAILRNPPGSFGWPNSRDEIWAVRLDGLPWPATSTLTWEIEYVGDASPDDVDSFGVRSRSPYGPFLTVVGPDPDNYVLYAGLAYKFKQTNENGTPLTDDPDNGGIEALWLREEVIVRDLIECPIIQPGSTKAQPALPRPYMTGFGNTGFGNLVARFDPYPVVTPDRKRLLLVGGTNSAAEEQEDAFVIRNISVTSAGTVSRLIGNITGHKSSAQSAGFTVFRAFHAGGHGAGRKAAFSPDGTKVAMAVLDHETRRDWIQIALSSGASFGKVLNVHESAATGQFLEGGVYLDDRIVTGLRFADNDHVLFCMGKNPYDAPLTGADSGAMDVFLYTISTNALTNLTLSGGGTGFDVAGRLSPAGYFASSGGEFSFIVRGGRSGATSPLPPNTQVVNLLGINHDGFDVFDIAGTEFSGGGLIPDLVLPASASEMFAPYETALPMQFIEGTGVQAGLLYWSAHRHGGNGSDDVFALNRDEPFVAFEATQATLPGVHVSNISPDPYSGKVAFARTSGSSKVTATQHAFVVDLDEFLFERDLVPALVSGGQYIGRLMDGSLHYLPPSAGAPEALVFSFGYQVVPSTGQAHVAAPVFYSLGAVSSPLIEPVPVLVPMIDTFLLGVNFRFYLSSVSAFVGPDPEP